MPVSPENRMRYRAILISREVRHILIAVPERFAKAVVGRWFFGLLLRWLFLGPDDKPHRGGEIVLAQLRRRTGYGRPTIFDPDPQVMAFREGQRAVVQEIFMLLNLDEAAVGQLMEVDDGLGSE
jgi:hypothetical protein